MNKKLEASLNPNATEFVPFALRSTGKYVLDRSESSASTNSEEDALRYWDHHLPDDITPDYKVMGSHNTPEINSLSFSNLSLTDISVGSRTSIPAHRLCAADQAGRADLAHFESSASTRSDSMLKPYPLNGNSYAVNQRYPISFFGENLSPTRFQPSLAKPSEKQIVRNDQHSTVQRRRFSGNSSRRFLADMLNELDREDVGALEFLASLFPGLASGSLAEVYVANGGDLNLTIEVLSRHELQGDGCFNQILNSEAISPRNPNAFNFPSFFAPDDHQNLTPYRSSVKDKTPLFRSFSSTPSRGATDFASAVRKMEPSRDSSIWKYERNGSSGASIGPSISSQVPASSYSSAKGKHICGDRLLNQGAAHASPFFEERVGIMYSEMREKARDHAPLPNAYFEQAQQAYLIGNKALAKELSIEGQLHSLKMRAPQQSIYRQRNTGNGRERIINLHGLGVSEAIHVVKQELVFLRDVVRSTGQHVLVHIHVGTRGPRTPARLPTAVQQYLLEEEGLGYSEPQPGVLQVVIC